MLEIQAGQDGFTVYDTAAGEPVMRFATRREADELVAALQIREVHAELRRWSTDHMPSVY
jgi:hypothetical protein